MAYYKDTKHVKNTNVGLPKYDTIWSPGEKPKYPSISAARAVAMRMSLIVNAKNPLPAVITEEKITMTIHGSC
ncbi:hypothetical protein [Dickeya dadantii]|uniref:hypothetical protein n=1 Tax=Dickeya dadantii TaxID=204038 RepID=UPI001CC68191|nr:hypothetical protein [Dickeya dadantii]